MVTHFLENQSLRELVEKTEKHSTEYDVLAQTSVLSLKLFGEDCIEDYSKPGMAGKLWVMYDFGSPKNAKADDASSVSSESTCDTEEDWVQPEPGCDGRPRLLGFLLAKLLPNTGLKGGQAFTVVFAGVPVTSRGKGIGKKLAQSVIQHGREKKNISLVTLSAIESAIPFWTRCGFKAFPDAMEVQEGCEAGQVYMTISVKGKGKAKKSRK